MRRLLVIACVLLMGLGVGGQAWALSYSGSITGTGGDGLFGTDGWDDATLEWTVDDNSHAGYWTYDYIFTVDEKGISHFIFEVSEGFTGGNINETYTTPGYKLDTYSSTAQGQSNPGLLGDLYGLKWDTTGDDVFSFSAIIVSDKNPMWGDFYAKDGVVNSGGIKTDVYAYNSQFGTNTAASIGNGNAGGWVLVPDTASVPEPATLLLLGSGLLGVTLLSRKRPKTKS